MRKSRFSDEQIVGIIQEYAAGAKVYGAGRPVDMMDKPDGLPTSPLAQHP